MCKLPHDQPEKHSLTVAVNCTSPLVGVDDEIEWELDLSSIAECCVGDVADGRCVDCAGGWHSTIQAEDVTAQHCCSSRSTDPCITRK